MRRWPRCFVRFPGLHLCPQRQTGHYQPNRRHPEGPAPAEAELTPTSETPDIAAPDPLPIASVTQPNSPMDKEAVEATPDEAATLTKMGGTSDGPPVQEEDRQPEDLDLSDTTPPSQSASIEEEPFADAHLSSDPDLAPGADAETNSGTLKAPQQVSATASPVATSAEGEAPFAEVPDTDETAPDPTPTDLPAQSAEPAAFHSRRVLRPDEEARDEPGARLAAILPRLGGIRAQNPGKPGASAAPALGVPVRDDAASPKAAPASRAADVARSEREPFDRSRGRTGSVRRTRCA